MIITDKTTDDIKSLVEGVRLAESLRYKQTVSYIVKRDDGYYITLKEAEIFFRVDEDSLISAIEMCDELKKEILGENK